MKYIYRVHALQRMFERKISKDDVEEIVKSGTVLESYLDDKPYPSFLTFGFNAQSRPIHVIYAVDNETCIIITAYEPSDDKWENYSKRR